MAKGTAAVIALLLGGQAGAANLDFGVAYGGLSGGTLSGAWGRLGASDLSALGGTVAFGVSSRALDASYSRNLTLPPLGVITSRTEAGVAWSGGVRLASRVTASVGPVALNVGSAFFSAPVTAFDPLAAYALAPADLRVSGSSFDLTGRYRVSRTLVAVVGGELGAQPNLSGGVEGRRDLTRALPLPADAQPGDEPETESVGTLNWRAGLRAGRGVLGVTGGVSYAAESGTGVSLDGLLGPGSLGLVGSLNLPGRLGEGSTLRLYAAYEPWRSATLPLRFGVEAGLSAGPGQLKVNASGGRTAAGVSGYGVRVGYSFPLGSDGR